MEIERNKLAQTEKIQISVNNKNKKDNWSLNKCRRIRLEVEQGVNLAATYS